MTKAELVEVIARAAGGSRASEDRALGAFMAVAVACRYPWLFRAAVGMSGTYDVEGLMSFKGDQNYYFSAPLSFVPNLAGGPLLEALRQRFIVLAYGQGRWENPDESWRMAGVLGAKGVPNRVDPWGPQYDHDWPTWREMLPLYLDDLVP